MSTPFQLRKLLVTASNLSEGTVFSVSKIRQLFSQSEHRDRLDPCPSPVGFCSFFKDPAPFRATSLLKQIKEAYS